MYIIYGLLLTSLLFVCDNKYSRKYYVPLKVACSASFLVIGIVNKAEPIVLGALAFCAAGDVLMALYNVFKRKRFLIVGIVTFFLAHVGFISEFYIVQPGFSLWHLVAPACFFVAFYEVYRLAHLHMGSMKIPGAIYCFMVSFMCAKALMIGGRTAVGGVLFFLSDFSILFLYFYYFRNKGLKKWVHYFNLITYYVAVAIFAINFSM